jgi:ATP-dependent Clp protease ATP-binding subunit ClpA
VLTDSNGKKVDFSNVVLIMTTNAGAADAQRQSIGFGRDKVTARKKRPPSSACSRRSSATASTRSWPSSR